MKTTAAVLWERHGKWEVEEYALDAINQGYADLHDGVNLRGMIRF